MSGVAVVVTQHEEEEDDANGIFWPELRARKQCSSMRARHRRTAATAVCSSYSVDSSNTKAARLTLVSTRPSRKGLSVGICLNIAMSSFDLV